LTTTLFSSWMTVVMVREDINNKLKKYRSRLNIRKHFFSNRVVSHWNSLPSHVVDADTVLTFKKRLDACNEWGIQSWWSFLARHQQVTSELTNKNIILTAFRLNGNYILKLRALVVCKFGFAFVLTLWRPLLPYGYDSYKASCARPCFVPLWHQDRWAWMTLNCCKVKFSWNSLGISRFLVLCRQ